MSSGPKPGKFGSLPEIFYSKVEPTPIADPKIVCISQSAQKLLGMAQVDADYIVGAKKYEGGDYISTVYAGHQFGSFVPQLGDGRALLLGEMNGYEVQLKGAGKTPYSRFGDGRAVLRSSIREFLCSEAMHFLGVPTTRALCVVAGSEPVQRECIEQAAVIARISRSHIRFGHFEYFHYRGMHNEVKELADFTRQNYFNGASVDEMFHEIVTSTAKLMAKWQAYGFCHGVMNTDNMSVLGVTIDYGPFGFLDNYDPGHICNHSDHTGRYAYEQQPGIGLWNLQALAEALSSILPYEKSVQSLQQYQTVLVKEYSGLMRAKFGLTEERDEDLYIVSELLNLLYEHKQDYTIFFRKLSGVKTAKELPPEFEGWFKKYSARLEAEPDTNRKNKMDKVNPKYILRNYIAQQVIEKAERGDYSEVAKVLTMLEKPYDEQPEFEDYAKKPPAWAEEIEVSCSS